MALTAHFCTRNHKAQLLHLAHALLFVLTVFQHVHKAAQFLAFSQFRGQTARIAQNLVGHAQFLGHMACVLQFQRFALPWQIVKESLCLGFFNASFSNELDDRPGISPCHGLLLPAHPAGCRAAGRQTQQQVRRLCPRGFSIPSVFSARQAGSVLQAAYGAAVQPPDVPLWEEPPEGWAGHPSAWVRANPALAGIRP